MSVAPRWCNSTGLQNSMFSMLSSRIVTDYAPGSEKSNICVLSASDFAGLSDAQVAGIFSRQHILVRADAGKPESTWGWNLRTFSMLRPAYGTRLLVQGMNL